MNLGPVISMLQFRRAARVLPVILLFALAGCATRRAAAPPPAPPVQPVPPKPVDVIPAPRREVAILFNSAPGYADVTNQLKTLLPAESYKLTLVDVEAESAPQILSTLRSRPRLFVVAIGLPAARIARDQFKSPVVFAQVFNYKELLVDGRAIRGVTAIPPLDLQVQDWKKLDPKLGRIGLIVSERHADLIREAQLAAESANVTIRHAISDSDRETLYQFKRLAPQIDGLWLVPDDKILSPTMLRELLSYASSHGVRVCVFSDALLPWGALLSASPTTNDVARTVRRVLETIMAGDTKSVPALTPLTEISVRINEQVAGRFGLSPQPRASWVVRGGR
jgi:ABC-type uncharacterized transport system substrate-binding protein